MAFVLNVWGPLEHFYEVVVSFQGRILETFKKKTLNQLGCGEYKQLAVKSKCIILVCQVVQQVDIWQFFNAFILHV